MSQVLSRHWPVFGIRVRTARLELRVPTPSDLDALADLAAEGIHDPDVMPFTTPWTDVAPEARARSVLQWCWRLWGQFAPEAWTLNFAVLADGAVVGIQDVSGTHFATLREVETASWVGRRFQGKGIGTEMRAAVLHLAFAGLGAETAISGAFTDNPASLAVSRRLGYTESGLTRHVRRGEPATQLRLRLDRAAWERHRTVDVDIDGLDECWELLGLPTAVPQGPNTSDGGVGRVTSRLS